MQTRVTKVEVARLHETVSPSNTKTDFYFIFFALCDYPYISTQCPKFRTLITFHKPQPKIFLGGGGWAGRRASMVH